MINLTDRLTWPEWVRFVCYMRKWIPLAIGYAKLHQPRSWDEAWNVDPLAADKSLEFGIQARRLQKKWGMRKGQEDGN